MTDLDKHAQGWRDQQQKREITDGIQFALAFIFIILFFAFLAV